LSSWLNDSMNSSCKHNRLLAISLSLLFSLPPGADAQFPLPPKKSATGRILVGVTLTRGRGLVQHTGFTTLIDLQGTRRIDYYGDFRRAEVPQDIAAVAMESPIGSPPKSEERTFDVKIERGKVIGGVKTVRVKQGEQVSLRWTTDETVAVHLHGYDIEKIVKPGETTIMSFKTHATGRFAVESHNFGDKKSRHVVLLYLEVLPR
jgi:hypothetical protein